MRKLVSGSLAWHFVLFLLNQPQFLMYSFSAGAGLLAIVLLLSQPSYAQTSETKLQKAVEQAETITLLDLSFSELDSLSSEVATCQQLKTLNLSHNQLQVLPPELVQLRHLQVLDLSHNPDLDIRQVIGIMARMKGLQEVKLNNCTLTWLPESLGKIKHLKRLELANNDLDYLPPTIGRLRELTYLDVAGSQFNRLPRQLKWCKQLTFVRFGGQNRHNWERSLAILSFLPELKNLSIENLTTVPEILFTFQSLETLEMSAVKLGKVDAGWKSMTTLHTLKLSGTIAAKPDKTLRQLAQIPALKELHLANLGWETMPLELNRFKKLEVLFIQDPALVNIESTSWRLSALRSLTIQNARGLHAQQWLSQKRLVNGIEHLSLINCGITTLPEEIRFATELKQLALTGNLLEESGTGLSELLLLQECSLLGNELPIAQLKALEEALPKCDFQYAQKEEIQASSLGEFEISATKMAPKKRSIQPPVANLAPKGEFFTVNAANGTTWRLKSGSFLKIPANAFLDAEGNPVTGEVDLNYIEYTNALDIALSGIPMTYDSAGRSYTFQSAGMIDFSATQNGVPLQPNPNALIQVNMASPTAATSYNLYALDTATGQWSNEGKDEVVPTTRNSRQQPKVDSPPVRPQQLGLESYDPYQVRLTPKKNKGLVLQVKGKRMRKGHQQKFHYSWPELKTMNRVALAYEGDSLRTDYSKLRNMKGVLTYNKTLHAWRHGNAKRRDRRSKRLIGNYNLRDEDEFALSFQPETDNFTFQLNSGTDTLDFPVFPVINSTQNKRIQRECAKWYAAYHSTAQQREAQWKATAAERAEALAIYEQEMEDFRKASNNYRDTSAYYAWQLANNQFGALWQSSQPAMRVFSLNSFSIYNCDQVRRMERPRQLAANFVDQSGNKISSSSIMVVDLGANAVFSYWSADKVYYDAKSTVALLFVLRNGFLAIASPQDCVGLNNSQALGKPVISMTVLDGDHSSSEELQRIMGI